MNKKSEIKWLFHLLGWAIFFIAPLLLSPGPVWHSLTPDTLMSLLVRNIILMILFYLNLFYLTPVFLKRYGVAAFVSLLLSLVVVVSFFNAGFHQRVAEGRDFMRRPAPNEEGMRRMNGPRFPPPVMIASPEFSSLLITLMVAATSTLLVLWSQWAKAEAEKNEQAHQKITAELTALKLQISPHFLFNTLNNIRWLVRSKSEHAEDAVVKLSHLLRYMLYQTETNKVELDKEIRHLNDFIELQKMRISEIQNLSITLQGDPTGKFIVPLLLLPLVENFFKYGDFTSTNQNTLSIVIADNRLKFVTSNRVSTHEQVAGGIGLTNVTRRLALHYPGQHTLKYYERDSVFYLELDLQLSTITNDA